MTTLYQCDLVQDNGTTRTKAYIPAKVAKVGKRITLEDSNNPLVKWTVESVPDKGIDEKYLSELKVAYRKQREASDI